MCLLAREPNVFIALCAYSYFADRSGKIAFRHSLDNGQTWGNVTILLYDELADSLDYLRISAASSDDGRIVFTYNAVHDRATGWSNLIMFRSNNSGFDWFAVSCRHRG